MRKFQILSEFLDTFAREGVLKSFYVIAISLAVENILKPVFDKFENHPQLSPGLSHEIFERYNIMPPFLVVPD